METSIEIDKDIFRKRLNKYTRKAFQTLPEMDRPRILDIGCGCGVPTMELARLCDGEIIGLDIDQVLLEKLERKIIDGGLKDRVKTVKCSMFELDFQRESFDIIWAEGSISVIGFERGLVEWRRLLKPGGFLVVHDDLKNIKEKIEGISRCGYDLLEYFELPAKTWLRDYYDPLEKHIEKIRMEYIDDPGALAVLDDEQKEIEMVKKNPVRYASVFYIMQKKRY